MAHNTKVQHKSATQKCNAKVQHKKATQLILKKIDLKHLGV